MGVRGLWLGLLTSSLTCFVVFTIVLTRADWEHVRHLFFNILLTGN